MVSDVSKQILSKFLFIMDTYEILIFCGILLFSILNIHMFLELIFKQMFFLELLHNELKIRAKIGKVKDIKICRFLGM